MNVAGPFSRGDSGEQLPAASALHRQRELEEEVRQCQRIAAELRQSEEAYRVAFEGATVAMAHAAPDSGRFLRVNRALCELTGYSREELLQMSFMELTHPEDAEPSRARLLQAVRGEVASYAVDKRYVRKDRKMLWVSITANLVRDSAGRPLYFVGLVQDVTGRKQAEEALERTQARLETMVQERTARLREMVEELEHLSYTLAHDLRAPLRAIQGFTAILSRQCGSCTQPRSGDYYERIMNGAERLDQLIVDALNYSKLVQQNPPLQPVNLAKLLQGLVETYPNLQPSKADIRIGAELPPVLGNEALLTQCFSNLLGNAVKFVAPGVQPRVRVWAQSMDSGELKVDRPPGNTPGDSQPSTIQGPLRSSPRLVRVYVEDNGIGIPAEWQQRIFDLFQRLNNSYEGTGLGLAIVRKAVERMGGKVGVESQPGQGSRFWVELSAAKS